TNEPAPGEITGVRKTYPNATHLASLPAVPEAQPAPLSAPNPPTRQRLFPRLLMVAGTLVASITLGSLLSSHINTDWLTAPKANPAIAPSADTQVQDLSVNSAIIGGAESVRPVAAGSPGLKGATDGETNVQQEQTSLPETPPVEQAARTAVKRVP